MRTSRSDDLAQYGKNHNVVDRVKLLDGQIIEGSEAQMKFVGKRNQLFERIAREDGKFSRYRGVKLELPSEQFDGAAEFCKHRAQRLRKQADIIEHGRPAKAAALRLKAGQMESSHPEQAARLRNQAEQIEHGKPAVAAKLRREADNYEQLANDVSDSGLTTQDAIFYREHPKIATALDIARTSHKAGVEGAKYGALIGGVISLLTNAFSVAQEKNSSARRHRMSRPTQPRLLRLAMAPPSPVRRSKAAYSNQATEPCAPCLAPMPRRWPSLSACRWAAPSSATSLAKSVKRNC